ncbi:MAG: HAD family hydrolase [Chitinophagales bacterium]
MKNREASGIGNDVFPAVVFDIDGVLADHSEPVAPAVAEKLVRIAAYARLIFASGKPAPYLEGLARGLGLEEVILIGENGGVVYFPVSREEYRFDDQIRELQILAQELKERLKDKVWFQPNQVAVTMFPRQETTVADLEKAARQVLLDMGYHQMVLYVHEDAVDIVPHEMDKGWALDLVAGILDIQKSSMIVVGNGSNDIPMIQRAGLSICIGENEDVVKEADITFHKVEDALIFILDRLEPDAS